MVARSEGHFAQETAAALRIFMTASIFLAVRLAAFDRDAAAQIRQVVQAEIEAPALAIGDAALQAAIGEIAGELLRIPYLDMDERALLLAQHHVRSRERMTLQA